MVKEFRYDVLIEREDICNREKEISFLKKAAHSHKKIVLLAPRRYGKTSLVKNVVARDFESKKALVVYADFMEVGSLASLANRLQTGISQSLSQKFPAKTKIQKLVGFFKNLSVKLQFDPVTSAPSFELSAQSKDDQKNLAGLFDSLIELSRNYSLLLILDEFQDIAFVPEAQALLRGFLQKLQKASVFILGSKKHLLQKIFLDSRAPLYQYGDEVNLEPILLKSWIPYFEERLSPKKMRISDEDLGFLLDKLYHVPNAICELGAWLVENYEGRVVTRDVIIEAMDTLVDQRQTYAYRLQAFSELDKRVLFEIAKKGYVISPHATEFILALGKSKSTIGNSIHKLMDQGLLEQELDRGYRLSDPILGHYLVKKENW